MSAGSRVPASRAPVAWGLILIPAVAQLLLHLLTAGRYGIFRDEYYYLACANRPAWGYVDQPALSIWILAGWKALFGDSVHAIRVLPALCGSALIVLTGALAAELGGRRWAQILAALAVAGGAAGLVIGGFYSMNAFDLVFWTAAFLLVVRIARTGQGWWWPWLGVVLGVGLLNKIGLVVFGVALGIGLLATGHRRHLLDRRLWLAVVVAAIGLLPYVFWNATHGWPTREFIENATRDKIADMPPLVFLGQVALETNPLTLPVWLGGLVWLFLARRAGPYRIVAVMFILTLAILLVQKSKPYYLAGAFPALMAAGGTAWEGWTCRGGWRWTRWALAAVLVIGAVAITPMVVPVMPLEDALAYQERLGIVSAPSEVGHASRAPQHFSDRFGWEELARTVADVYAALSPDERARCVIVAENYGHAGALEYWSRRYDLPLVFSSHNNYWFWGPPPEGTEVVILVGYRSESVDELFEEVEAAGDSRSEHALESSIPIRIARGPRRPVTEVWTGMKMFI